eukprot:scaffold120727_cov23-Tisochrysis_lutea.AAC.2
MVNGPRIGARREEQFFTCALASTFTGRSNLADQYPVSDYYHTLDRSAEYCLLCAAVRAQGSASPFLSLSTRPGA